MFDPIIAQELTKSNFLVLPINYSKITYTGIICLKAWHAFWHVV